jgi:signal transduction histidine kinase
LSGAAEESSLVYESQIPQINESEMNGYVNYNSQHEHKETFVKFKLEIIDTGVGISKENLDKLFIDFNKLDEHLDMNEIGTGLGLSICKKIIE